MLKLGTNRVKDFGVEAMSCATLGQDCYDHRKRQGQARRRQEHLRSKLPPPRAFGADGAPAEPPRTFPCTAAATPVTEGCGPRPGRLATDRVGGGAAEPEPHAGNLPPLVGTPLHEAAAAPAAWSKARRRGGSPTPGAGDDGCSPPRRTAWSVVLDGNRVSGKLVAGQSALAGLGEAALFRGCVLPETVAASNSWTGDAFWTKPRGGGEAHVDGGRGR